MEHAAQKEGRDSTACLKSLNIGLNGSSGSGHLLHLQPALGMAHYRQDAFVNSFLFFPANFNLMHRPAGLNPELFKIENYKLKKAKKIFAVIVRQRRFELPRQLRRYHLKVVRLPISPPPLLKLQK